MSYWFFWSWLEYLLFRSTESWKGVPSITGSVPVVTFVHMFSSVIVPVSTKMGWCFLPKEPPTMT